ncbi:MAG TPA: DUF5700 domain-containing putative Zn-dependent protease [Pyrinomonadaceae bacterium]|jgi:hypothetical protein
MNFKLRPAALTCALALCAAPFLPAVSFAQASAAAPRAVGVRLVTDEAEAVLAVLSKRSAGQAVTDDDWARVFASEGYARLKKREHSMQRSFGDEDFKKFVLSDALAARAGALAATLARWKGADVSRSARLALAYLPPGARITAKIYPVIKPRENSFVFEVKSDPAIFLYLDPSMGKERFENYLAHEMHHIGYGTACPTPQTAAEIARLPPNARTVVTYIGAFGEGFAMLAAAGGARVHPHATSGAKDRARWDRDVANFNADLKKVERFFLDVLAGNLSEAQIGEQVSAFFGEQGAWYTVGWKMCFVVERTFGRRALVEAMCDQRKLLATYNRAAALYGRPRRERLATWSPSLLKAVAGGGSASGPARPCGVAFA